MEHEYEAQNVSRILRCFGCDRLQLSFIYNGTGRIQRYLAWIICFEPQRNPRGGDSHGSCRRRQVQSVDETNRLGSGQSPVTAWRTWISARLPRGHGVFPATGGNRKVLLL